MEETILKHIPVLLNDVLEMLGDIHGRTIVDCTFGAGGYTRAFLERGANVIAFDRDKNVIADAEQIKKEYGDRFRFINDEFSAINQLDNTEFDDVVFDLGISSMQIDNGDRGFSFRFDGPLDMRMDSGAKHSALDLIKEKSADELADILYEYGDVKKSRLLAKIIKQELPTTTFQLRDLIKNPHDIAPVFQALRIAVNDEMGQIKSALESVHNMLRVGGKCACVTFHSIEDRLVKNTFKQWTTNVGDPRLPETKPAEYKMLKVYMPSDEELNQNPRARSAHLRGVQKG
ncbi:MAG: 16S rRNA (cytosine(1402)-N(4))-methyltransferase RsmH [Alphaproteobacteria bacterium]|nr:16S rRNA (cytosine(1402)-N(4))-methyltransferase RsmH [Alphaproteobacteria bacterium]